LSGVHEVEAEEMLGVEFLFIFFKCGEAL
jgi:hypothetical protein